MTWVPFYTNCNYCGKRIVCCTHLNKQNILVSGVFCDAICQEASLNEVDPPESFILFHEWCKVHGGGPPLEFVTGPEHESASSDLEKIK